MNLNIASNRSARKYSRKELSLRVFWAIGRLVFRLSPRPCFGFRRWLLRMFGAKIGQRVNIYPSVLIYFPWNLEIGDDSAIGEWALVYNLGKVTIGKKSTISQRVHLCAGTHDYRDSTMPLVKPPIIVGDEVWLCADVFVGPNISIAARAIIAATPTVVKNVEKSEIVGGNPARFIKKREPFV